MNDIPQLQFMQQLGRTYRALMAAFEAEIGHSLPRWRILLYLYQTGDVSQKQLVLALQMDPAAITRQVKVIEKKGWIARHNDAGDNRLTNVVLTAAGKTLVEQTLPCRAAFFEKALGGMSPQEMQALGLTLTNLEQRLRHYENSPVDHGL